MKPLNTTLSALILAAALAGAASAKPPSPSAAGRPPAAPAGSAAYTPVGSGVAAALPAELAALGLADVVSHQERNRHGELEARFHGRMPDGTWVRFKARDGRLVAAKSSDDASLPRELLDLVVPSKRYDASELRAFERITWVEIMRHGEIKFEGFGAGGLRLKLEFRPYGQVALDREFLPRWGMPAVQVRQMLQQLGYAQVGFVETGPRHAEAVALNPYGEWVDVRINDRGEIDRQRRWLP
jgi:hypothetical protein